MIGLGNRGFMGRGMMHGNGLRIMEIWAHAIRHDHHMFWGLSGRICVYGILELPVADF